MQEGEEEELQAYSDGLMEDDGAGTIRGRLPNCHPRRALRMDDISEMLLEHASQASVLADRAAVAEEQLMAFALDGTCPDPDSALKVAERLERLRRSASEDIRRTASALGELHRRPTPVQIAVVSQAVSVKSGHQTGHLLDGEGKER